MRKVTKSTQCYARTPCLPGSLSPPVPYNPLDWDLRPCGSPANIRSGTEPNWLSSLRRSIL